MIISHKYRFIFLKTEKTAGTSIEIALSKHCGPDDIITPISPEDEETRAALGFPGPQNYLAPINTYGIRDYARLLFRQRRKALYYNHINAARVRTNIGSDIWNTYYKFCFERNPFDRVISHYYWCNKTIPRPSLTAFLETERLLSLHECGYRLYTINSEVAVDRVCFYENLEHELEEVRLLLGIPERLVLPHAKAGYREDRRNYRDILSESEQSKISAIFRTELALWGYKF